MGRGIAHHLAAHGASVTGELPARPRGRVPEKREGERKKEETGALNLSLTFACVFLSLSLFSSSLSSLSSSSMGYTVTSRSLEAAEAAASELPQCNTEVRPSLALVSLSLSLSFSRSAPSRLCSLVARWTACCLPRARTCASRSPPSAPIAAPNAVPPAHHSLPALQAPQQHLAFAADVRDRDAVQSVCRAALQGADRASAPSYLSAVVNSAGVAHNALCVRASEEDARDMAETNFLGALNVATAAGEAMLKQRKGGTEPWGRAP